MTTLDYAVEPGGLSEAHHQRIAALAARRWSAPRIAREIGKHPSTVQWFMYRTGLRAPKPITAPRQHQRGGRVVRRFTAEEDTYIRALRLEGAGLSDIARRATERFGHPRSPHTIHCRLVMLACLEDA